MLPIRIIRLPTPPPASPSDDELPSLDSSNDELPSLYDDDVIIISSDNEDSDIADLQDTTDDDDIPEAPYVDIMVPISSHGRVRERG